MYWNKNNHIINIIYIITVVFFLGYLLKNNTLMLYMLLSIYVCEFIYVARKINKNISYILFLVAFFTFLMGRIVLPIFIDTSLYSEIFYSSLNFSNETYRHIYLSLYLTLLFLFLGYYSVQTKNDNLKNSFNPFSYKTVIIRKISKILVFSTMPFAIFNIIDEIRFVLANGYQSLLVDYESSLPTYLLVCAVLYKYMFLLYLSTLPSKREAKYVIITFCLISVLNLAAGDRGEAMLALFAVIFYFFLRNRLYSQEEYWIGKKGVVILACSAPLIMCLLFLIAYFRSDSEINVDQVSFMVGGFFHQQGASVNVIACTFEDYDLLPKNRLYSLGAIFDYFSNNYLSRFLFGTEPYPIASVELALYGRSLDPAITYLESPSYYFNGGGMGSCFIAEAWYDFGYLGVILYSMFYGYVLAKIPSWCGKNIWLCIIAMILFENILYAPRARATTFLVSALSVSFWPIAFCIYLYAVYKSKRRYEKNCNLYFDSREY